MGRHDLHRSTCAPYSFAVRERPIGACPDASRGSSARLGLDALPQELPDPLYDENAPYADGALRYELTDHLGNVCAVVSDALEGYSTDTDPDAEEYHAELLSAQEYEPFGSLLPGRNYSSDSYRFGFNGKVNDNEVFGAIGTFQDYGFRMYDARTGRFFSLDPLAYGFPYYTPYQFSGNCPIAARDLDGLEEDIVITLISDQFPTPQIVNLKWTDIEGNIGTNGPMGTGTLNIQLVFKSGEMMKFAQIYEPSFGDYGRDLEEFLKGTYTTNSTRRSHAIEQWMFDNFDQGMVEELIDAFGDPFIENGEGDRKTVQERTEGSDGLTKPVSEQPSSGTDTTSGTSESDRPNGKVSVDSIGWKDGTKQVLWTQEMDTSGGVLKEGSNLELSPPRSKVVNP